MKPSQFYFDPSIKCKNDWLLPQSYHSYFECLASGQIHTYPDRNIQTIFCADFGS